jgi:hypothetical protein
VPLRAAAELGPRLTARAGTLPSAISCSSRSDVMRLFGHIDRRLQSVWLPDGEIIARTISLFSVQVGRLYC